MHYRLVQSNQYEGVAIFSYSVECGGNRGQEGECAEQPVRPNVRYYSTSSWAGTKHLVWAEPAQPRGSWAGHSHIERVRWMPASFIHLYTNVDSQTHKQSHVSP